MMAMDGRSERTNFIKNTFKKIWSLESHPVDITLMLFGREYYNTNWENAMEHGFIKQSDDVRDSLRIYIDAVSGIYTEEDIEGLAGHHTGDESKRVWRCDEEKERRIAMYMPIDRVLCLNNLKNDFELLYNKQGLIPGVETNILRAAIDKVNDMYFIESGNYGSHLPDGKQLRSDIWNETPEEHKVPFFVYLPRRIEDISINPIMSVFNNFRGVLETAKNKLIEEKKGPG
jgi:hypothetical protein